MPDAWLPGRILKDPVDYKSREETLRYLRDRNYAKAAESYKRFSGYRDGDEPQDFPAESFIFGRRYNEAIISMYQSHYCPGLLNGSSFNTIDDETGATTVFSRALVAAAQGNRQESIIEAKKSLALDPDFSYALTFLGIIEAKRGNMSGARMYWLEGAANPDHPIPQEAIGFLAKVPIEILLHLRP